MEAQLLHPSLRGDLTGSPFCPLTRPEPSVELKDGGTSKLYQQPISKLLQQSLLSDFRLNRCHGDTNPSPQNRRQVPDNNTGHTCPPKMSTGLTVNQEPVNSTSDSL